MEKLIKKAIKAMGENTGFNEITLSDGKNTVHLVRYTQAPYWNPPVYQYQYPIQNPAPIY